MRILTRDGRVFHTKPRSTIQFTKELGHSTRVKFQLRDGLTLNLRAREVEVMDHKKGGESK